MKSLSPFLPPRFGLEVEAGARFEGENLYLSYCVRGQIGSVLWPKRGLGERRDELWQHTCFEAFVYSGQSEYLEINLSPSGDWNLYHFENYRKGMRPEPLSSPPEIKIATLNQVWTLTAKIPMGKLLSVQRPLLGLTAVIEDHQNEVTYWALRHAGKQADFHLPESFILQL